MNPTDRTTARGRSQRARLLGVLTLAFLASGCVLTPPPESPTLADPRAGTNVAMARMGEAVNALSAVVAGPLGVPAAQEHVRELMQGVRVAQDELVVAWNRMNVERAEREGTLAALERELQAQRAGLDARLAELGETEARLAELERVRAQVGELEPRLAEATAKLAGARERSERLNTDLDTVRSKILVLIGQYPQSAALEALGDLLDDLGS